SPLRELVWYCLYKDPAHRPTTAQVRAGLGDTKTGVHGAVAPPSVPPPVTPQPAVLSTPPSPWGAGTGSGGWGTLPPDAPPPHFPVWGAPTSEPTAPPRPARSGRRWLPVVAASAAVVLVAVASIAIVRLAGRDDGAKPGTPAAAGPAVDAALTKVV